MRLYRSVVKLARNYGVLLAVILAGAFLRVYQLGTENLALDEGASLFFARLEGPWEIAARTRTDNNLPLYYAILYYAILHYWVALFGDSELSLRFPSALAGTLAVPAMYGVGRLVFDRATGLTAALILALSPFHVEYLQEARAYALMSLMALLSFYFFVKFLRGERGAFSLAAYVVCTSALMYSRVYGCFVVLAQNASVATALLAGSPGSREEAWAGLKVWVPLQAVLAVLYVPGFVLLRGSLGNAESRWWMKPPSPEWAYFVAREYSGSVALLAFLAAFSLLAIVALAKSGDGGKPSLLLAWLLVPTIVPAAISLLTTPMFVPRYAIAASVALYLLAAKGMAVTVARVRGKLGLRPAAVWLAAALALLSFGGLWRYFDAVENPR